VRWHEAEMSHMLAAFDQGAAVHRDADSPPSDSSRATVLTGLLILSVFFGGFGGWAAMAPLNSAVISEAVVKVDGNRKSVQHLDGGIVKELRVAEGDRVAEDEVLIVLDDTQVRAEHDVLSEQHIVLRATEARLRAELNGSAMIEFPADLTGRNGESSVRTALEGQRTEFESRRAALLGEEGILEQRLSQLREQISGNEAQVRSLRTQHQSIVDERRRSYG
jgi:membrane fusion protein, epimerase transport system